MACAVSREPAGRWEERCPAVLGAMVQTASTSDVQRIPSAFARSVRGLRLHHEILCSPTAAARKRTEPLMGSDLFTAPEVGWKLPARRPRASLFLAGECRYQLSLCLPSAAPGHRSPISGILRSSSAGILCSTGTFQLHSPRSASGKSSPRAWLQPLLKLSREL